MSLSLHHHTALCSEMSIRNTEIAIAARKHGFTKAADYFASRGQAYRGAQFDPPERLKEHLKGLIVIQPSYNEIAESFLQTVHEASVPEYEVKDGVLRFNIVGEVFGPPPFLGEKLKGCHRVEIELGNVNGGTGVKDFKDLLEGYEVQTTVTGFACSAGAYISQLGQHRRIHKAGALLLHPRIKTMVGNLFTLRRALADLEELHAIDAAFLVKRTGQPRVVVEAWLSGDDVVINAQKAIELGLADEVIE